MLLTYKGRGLIWTHKYHPLNASGCEAEKGRAIHGI